MKPTSLPTVERVSLSVFLGCMVITALLFLFSIWTQPDNEAVFKTVATFFVVGFANFLVWLPSILYRILKKLP